MGAGPANAPFGIMTTDESDMPRKYHTLLVRDDKSAPWCIHFGDYDRETVDSEREDMRDHDHRAMNLKIITTAPEQAAIDAAVARLNAAATN